MSRVILQPAGGPDAQVHYRDTIINPVPFEPNRDVLGAHYDALLERFPSSRAPMWGVTPGDSGRSTRLYDRASVGDLVLFAGQNRFFAAGTIAYKSGAAGPSPSVCGASTSTGKRGRTCTRSTTCTASMCPTSS